MTHCVLKWEVPVDDHQHLIGPGPVLHVDHQGDPTVVCVWTEEPDDRPAEPTRPTVAIGTGMAVPDSSEHLGSVIWRDPDPRTALLATALGQPSSLVWHVYAEVQS